MHSFSPRSLLCGLTCLFALAGGAAQAAQAEAPADPKAKQLLDEVIKTYKGLTSYADEESSCST